MPTGLIQRVQFTHLGYSRIFLQDFHETSLNQNPEPTDDLVISKICWPIQTPPDATSIVEHFTYIGNLLHHVVFQDVKDEFTKKIEITIHGHVGLLRVMRSRMWSVDNLPFIGSWSQSGRGGA